MFSKINIKIGLVMVVAALFLMAFAYQASAYSASGATPFTYTGKIVGFDNEHRFLTVQAGPNDERNFQVAQGAVVTKCNMGEYWNDLKIGDQVTISYFEEGSSGSYIANGVDLLPIGMERC
ncbi:MAG TPA: hypothetical protein VEF33_12695 [Syntrophales bacterium]|nr:hypothetical protein [Syntrophales bacterium]